MTTVGFLPLKITLTAPAVVPVTADPVRTVTSTVIPGRVLQGLLARAAGASDASSRQNRILDWVVRGDSVQVGPAFGAPPAGDDQPLRRRPVHPAPLSWHTTDRYDNAGHPGLVDLLDGDPVLTGVTRLKQVRSVVTSGTDSCPVRIDTAAWWHQQRNRQQGRPTESTGGPFEMIALSAGQVFTSSWRVSAATIDELNDLLDYELLQDLTEATNLRIGAAATTRYGGGVQLTLLDPIGPLPQVSRLQQRHTPTDPLTTWQQGTLRDVVLISPTLVPDGAPRSAAVTDAIHTAWGGSDVVTVVDSWIEHQRYGGYNSTWRSPVTEQWAAAPGSVVRLRALVDIPTATQFATEGTPIGLRCSEGTGRQLLLNPQQRPGTLGDPLPTRATNGAALHLLGNTIAAETTLPDGATTSPVRLPAPPDAWTWANTPVADLQHRLFRQAAAPVVRAAADAIIAKSTHIPTAHLLARISSLLADPDPTVALTTLRSALTAPESAAVFAAKATQAIKAWMLVEQPATTWLQTDPAHRDRWWAAVQRAPGSQLDLPAVLEPHTLKAWDDDDGGQTRRNWITQYNDDLAAALIRAVLTSARRAAKKDRI